MTGHDLLSALQDMGDDELNLEVVIYDEYGLNKF